MKCPKCGSESKDGALYCEMCYEPFNKKTKSVEQQDPVEKRLSAAFG